MAQNECQLACGTDFLARLHDPVSDLCRLALSWIRPNMVAGSSRSGQSGTSGRDPASTGTLGSVGWCRGHRVGHRSGLGITLGAPIYSVCRADLSGRLDHRPCLNKIVIDTTNPINVITPDEGVLLDCRPQPALRSLAS
jgi:hypothetical protein